jgi:hypothetical protein
MSLLQLVTMGAKMVERTLIKWDHPIALPNDQLATGRFWLMKRVDVNRMDRDSTLVLS